MNEAMPLTKLPAPDPDWALLLDVDGTLIQIAKTPKQARVESEMRTILHHLSDTFDGAKATDGRVRQRLGGSLSPFRGEARTLCPFSRMLARAGF
ncbi:MAG: hypothetical protein COA65_07550 [Rhodospirillaceae bacterium]|nr:MAG: hypothetical protein COA65_07550 [Rhodospirillaceae bacterium]